MAGVGPRRRLWLRIAFYGTTLLIVLPFTLSGLIVGTQRLPPGELQAGFEPVPLRSEGLRLRAWLTRGEAARPAALLVHGLGDSLESYTDLARALRRRGHTVLLVDLRGHGGSEGRYMTLGAREREDVRAGLEHLRRSGLAPAGSFVMGWSLGAVAALRAAAEREDVRAVIVEAPFDSGRETIALHARLLFGIPRWLPLLPLCIRIAEWRAGFRIADADAVAAARALRAPLLAIADGEDRRMPEAVVRRVWDAHPGPKRLWVAAGVDHVGAVLRPDYWTTVVGFLEEHGL